ncbi:hypothetical protein Mnod_5016 [Methylobacterium nodulans ORS 2060]|uniref:Integrase catalytic domain-containing protein n=1 Tax=Methylobacterium nodulans (strain LMG 21967 / CNCM I-2342 / ORS 2060) TaxID=460265 RepID=B8IIJ0_METNO|nr:hypothetical protein Mnod_5016 [Methylobacterium nodulans ORS 2060]
MPAQGGALPSAGLRAPPQNRRAIVPMGYGIQFVDSTPVNEQAEATAAASWAERTEPRLDRWHPVDWACEQNTVEHRLTKPRCPGRNGQVERMNRTISCATPCSCSWTSTTMAVG